MSYFWMMTYQQIILPFVYFFSFSSFAEKRTRGSVDFSGYDSKTGSETYSGQLDSFDPSEGYEVFIFTYITIFDVISRDILHILFFIRMTINMRSRHTWKESILTIRTWIL